MFNSPGGAQARDPEQDSRLLYLDQTHAQGRQLEELELEKLENRPVLSLEKENLTSNWGSTRELE
jgi:hypothetical protein